MIKQIPDPLFFHKIKIDPVTNAIVRTGIPSVLNQLDRHALEEALRIKESNNAEVTAITMGPPLAREVLEEAVAMGADRAILLTDSEFAGADTLATAEVLASAARKLGGFDIIICGNESSDSGTVQVPAQVAEILGYGLATFVKSVYKMSNGSFQVKRDLGSYEALTELKYPSVISVIKSINKPRYFTVFNIMKLVDTSIEILGYKDVGVDRTKIGLRGSPTRVVAWFEQEVKREKGGLILTGPAEDTAKQAVRALVERDAI